MIDGETESLDRASEGGGTSHIYCVNNLSENSLNKQAKATQKDLKCRNKCASCSPPETATISTDPLEEFEKDYDSTFDVVEKTKRESITENMSRSYSPNGNIFKNSKRKRSKRDNEPELKKYKHIDVWGRDKYNSASLKQKPYAAFPRNSKKRGISSGDGCDCEFKPCCRCLEKNGHNNSQAQTVAEPIKTNRTIGTKTRKKERKYRKEHIINDAQDVENYIDTMKKNNTKERKVEKSTIQNKTPKPKNRMTCLCRDFAKGRKSIEDVFAEGPIRDRDHKKGVGIETVENDTIESCPTDSTTFTHNTNSTTTTKIKEKIACLCRKYSQKMLKRTRKGADRTKQKDAKVIEQSGEKLPYTCAGIDVDLPGKMNNNLNTTKNIKNEKEQTGDPFFDIKIDVVDNCVLNSKEIRENIYFLNRAQKKQPTCICPSHKKNLHKFYKRDLCADGICQKAYKDKNTNFTCKCSKIKECTDTTCEVDTKNNKKAKQADLKALSLPSKLNKAMFNVKLDMDSMCVLNPKEVEKKIEDAEIQAKKFTADICHTGLCTKTDRRGHFTCKCIEKKRKPEEIKVIECSNQTCGGKDMLPNNNIHSLKSNICELFKNIHVCECLSGDGKNEGTSIHGVKPKHGTVQTHRRIRKCLDTNEVQNIKSILTFCCSQIMNRSENVISQLKHRKRTSQIHKINNENKVKEGKRPVKLRKREGIKIKTKSKRIETKGKLNGVKNKKVKKDPRNNHFNSIFGPDKPHFIQSAYPNIKKIKRLLRGHEKSINVGHDLRNKKQPKATQKMARVHYNPMLELKLDPKNMSVLNADEVEEKIMNKEIKASKNIVKKRKKKQIEEPLFPLFEIKLDSSSMCILNQEEVEKNIRDENLSRIHQTPESEKLNKKRSNKMARRAVVTNQYFSQLKSKTENISNDNSSEFCKGKICTPRVRDELQIMSNQKGGSIICSSLCALINRCKNKVNRSAEGGSGEEVGMYKTNELVSSQKYNSKIPSSNLRSCICCVCGKQPSQCKCKIKADTSLKQFFGDSLTCLLKVLGIGDLLHSGNGDVRISKKNDLIKIEAKSTPNKEHKKEDDMKKDDMKKDDKKKNDKKKSEKKSAEPQLQIIQKDKKGRKIEKELKKAKKKERKIMAKEKEKEKEEEVKEKEKEKEEGKVKKKEQEESKSKKKQRERNEAKKRKQDAIEAKKRKKALDADNKKLAKEIKKKQKLDTKNRIKELKEEEKEMDALMKEDTTTDTNCLADIVIGILKLGAELAYGILKILHKIITDPKGSADYTKARMNDPKGSLFKLKKWFNDFWRHQKFRMMRTVKGSHTLTVLSDTFQDTALFEAFRPKGRTDKERIFIEGQNKRRKRRITKRQNEALYGCRHVLLTTLRKTPCLWFYHICPNHYPHCLSLLTFLRNFADMMLFLLAVLFWTPCIVSVELCRAMVCCFMCT